MRENFFFLSNRLSRIRVKNITVPINKERTQKEEERGEKI